MEFKELPIEVQIIAANALRALLQDELRADNKKPATELALEVSKSFIQLYLPAS